MTAADPTAWDALALSHAIRDRAVSCVEATDAYLARIAAANGPVNAIVSLRDPDELRAEAAARDADLARGAARGWLHGMPLAVKDLAATAGLRTTWGSPLFADHVPEADEIFVARLRAAGAILIGKTNVPEFGLGSHSFNPVFGTTRNPYDRSRSAGGSSGGAGAALALRMLPVADGSDMMGSLRNPAAWNNVFGLRPSWGRVPAGPKPEVFVHQLSTEGPMARTVADLAALLGTMAGHDPRAPLSLGEGIGGAEAPGAPRLAWLGDWGGHLAMEPGVLDLCEAALATFEAIGARVEPTAPPMDGGRLWDCWTTLRQWSVAGTLGAAHADPATRDLLKPEAAWEVERGLALSALDVHRASVERSAWHEAARALLENHDALALPSAQCFPFDADLRWPAEVGGRTMDTYHRWMEVVIAGSLSGFPVISVPAGFDARGLPMGLQLIGRPRGEAALLALAARYEAAIPEILARTP